MKAKQNFVIYLDSDGNRTSYYSGEPKQVTKKEFKVNDEVPDELVAELIKTNPEFLQVEYEAGQFKLTNEELIRFNMKSGKIERPPIVPKNRVSEDSLVKLYNKKGKKALEKRAAKLGLEFTSETSYNKLITMILNESEKLRRGG